MTWTRALDAFESDVQRAERNVKTAITDRVRQCGLSELGRLVKDLPTRISREIDACLDPHRIHFEQTLQSAVAKLEADYPRLDLGEWGGVTIRAKDDGTGLKGAVGGMAMAATGVGLAAAGSAAAAGIAAANVAALTATTTIAVPSLIAGLGTLLPGPLGGLLAAAGTGTATVGAPTALATAPLWVALSGPVGWTLAGVGALAIPLAWRISKSRQKDKIEDACADQIRQIFQHIRSERLPAIRKMAPSIVQEYAIRSERRLTLLEATFERAQRSRSNPNAVQELERSLTRFLDALTVPRGISPSPLRGSR